jgi:hypothetical protein
MDITDSVMRLANVTHSFPIKRGPTFHDCALMMSSMLAGRERRSPEGTDVCIG